MRCLDFSLSSFSYFASLTLTLVTLQVHIDMSQKELFVNVEGWCVMSNVFVPMHSDVTKNRRGSFLAGAQWCVRGLMGCGEISQWFTWTNRTGNWLFWSVFWWAKCATGEHSAWRGHVVAHGHGYQNILPTKCTTVNPPPPACFEIKKGGWLFSVFLWYKSV